MARRRVHEHDKHDKAQQGMRRPERSAHEQQSAVADSPGHQTDQSPSGSLLRDARLNGRGNGATRISAIQNMQQIYGNRATQRLLKKKDAGDVKSTAASEDGKAPPAEAPLDSTSQATLVASPVSTAPTAPGASQASPQAPQADSARDGNAPGIIPTAKPPQAGGAPAGNGVRQASAAPAQAGGKQAPSPSSNGHAARAPARPGGSSVSQRSQQGSASVGPSAGGQPSEKESDKDAKALATARAQFEQQVQAERAGIQQSVAQKKQQITTDARTQKQSVQQSIAAEIARLEGINSQSAQQIQQTTAASRGQILSNRDARIAATRQAAQLEIANLSKGVEGKQQAATRMGEEKATSVQGAGNEESQRATSTSSQKASQARSVASSRAAGAGNNVGKIAGQAGEMGSKAAGSILDAGRDLAQAAMSGASDIAGKLVKAGGDLAQKFTKAFEDGQKKIIEAQNATIEGLNKAAQEAVTRLETSSRDALSKLQTGRQQASQQLRKNGEAAVSAIDQSAQKALQDADKAAASGQSKLDKFAAEVSAQLGGASGKDGLKALADARAQLGTFHSQWDAGMVRFGSEAAQAFQDLARTGQEQARKQVDQLAEPVRKVGSDFTSKAGEAVQQVNGQMEGMVSKSSGEMRNVTGNTEKGLQDTLSQSEGKFNSTVTQGKAQMQSMVTSGLANHDQAVSTVSANVGKMAASAASTSIWSDITDFFKGVWDGFWEQVVDIFKGIGRLLSAWWEGLKEGKWWAWLLLIVVVVVAIVLIVFWEVVAAAVIAIGQFLFYLGIAVGVLFALYYLYMAIFGDNLTPYQRGKYVGKALLEILLLILGGKKAPGGAAGGVGKVGMAARLAELVKNEALVARLIRLAGEDEKLLALIVKAIEAGVDAEKLATLIEKVGGVEKAIALLDKLKDIDKLLKLLDKVNDAEKLGKLLDKVSDADKLLKLLDKVNDADKLLKLLDKVSDTDKLLKLLDKVSDADKLLNLLDKENDADVLLKLLDEFSDISLLENLLEGIGSRLIQKLLAEIDAAKIDELFKALDGPALKNLAEELGGTVIYDLFKNHGIGTPFLKNLALTPGAAKAIKDAIALFGGVDKLAIVLLKAEALAMDVRDVTLLLQKAKVNGWSDPARIVNFLEEVNKATIADKFRKAIEFAEIFTRVHSPTLPATPGGAAGGTVVKSITLTLSTGVTKVIKFTTMDLAHYLTRHTFEEFAFSTIKAQNSFFPPGTDVKALAEAALVDGKVEKLVNDMVIAGSNFDQTVTTAGHAAGVRLSLERIVNFFPTDPTFAIPKNILKGIKILLGK